MAEEGASICSLATADSPTTVAAAAAAAADFPYGHPCSSPPSGFLVPVKLVAKEGEETDRLSASLHPPSQASTTSLTGAAASAPSSFSPHLPLLASAKPLDRRWLLANTDVFVFDCDGVLWHGDSLIPGVQEALQHLKQQKKQMFFLTNNSSKSRQGYLKKFLDLGLQDVVSDCSQIVCTSFAVAAYLVSRGFRDTKKKVYVVGEAGIQEELELAGIPWIGGVKDSDKVIGESGVDVDPDVGCVVVGLDRQFNYYKLQYAQLCINELKADFIATNTDQLGHFTENQACAGSGAMVGAVFGCTGVNPTVIGKPHRHMVDILRRRLGGTITTDSCGSSKLSSTNDSTNSYRRCANPDSHHRGSGNITGIPANLQRLLHSRMLMVGDRIDTDILFGVNAGIGTLLTMTGITTAELLEEQVERRRQRMMKAAVQGDGKQEAEEAEEWVLPDFYIDSAADLFSVN